MNSMSSPSEFKCLFLCTWFIRSLNLLVEGSYKDRRKWVCHTKEKIHDRYTGFTRKRDKVKSQTKDLRPYSDDSLASK